MITAESFKKKIKEREDKLRNDIDVLVQNALKHELDKDHVSVPFTLTIKTDADNTDIVKQVLNTCGFNSNVVPSVEGVITVEVMFLDVKGTDDFEEKYRNELFLKLRQTSIGNDNNPMITMYPSHHSIYQNYTNTGGCNSSGI
ncbi:hypothetical protein XaC1_173 [Xanthomonas phage XaC1]|nr:hypothetical protein XaC1_173 [Xanthomonas phage XaC1]